MRGRKIYTLALLVGLSVPTPHAFGQRQRTRRPPRYVKPKNAPVPMAPQPWRPGQPPPQPMVQPAYPLPPPVIVRPMPPPAPPPARNQNQFGQPAVPPPHLKNREDIGGTKSWFGSTGAGFGFDTISRTNPGVVECSDDTCQKTIAEPRWALQLQGAAGWGPLKRNNFSFTTHYRYIQNLRTNEDQAGKVGQWFKTFNSADFIFPTRDMLRSHELVAEIRYSASQFQAGVHAMLDFERVGSNASFLGAPNEVSDSVRNVEQVVPWVQWRIPGTYIATLYTPMRTEINKEDPRNSFTTWSIKQAGRGMFISAVQDNLFYLPKISSTAGLTLNWTNKKSASIQNDSSRLGLKVVLDFPIAWNIRVQPYIKYDSENYILQRIKIDNITDGAASLTKRADSILGSGGQAYLDLSKNWRLNFNIAYESTQSSLSDFSGSKISYFAGLIYSWPLSRPVLRRLDRFSDSLAAEEN